MSLLGQPKIFADSAQVKAKTPKESHKDTRIASFTE